MKSVRPFLAVLLLVLLAACIKQALHVNVRFQRVDGLRTGDVVVFREQTVGAVESVEYTDEGVFLARLAVAPEYRAALTTDTRFYLDSDPSQQGRRRIELEQTVAGGQPLEDGATVEGADRIGLGGFGELFRGMGEGLRQFRDQVERFQQDLQKLPQSEDAKKLEEEWRRLLEQLDKAGRSAGEAIEKDLAPRLHKDMEEMEKRFRDLEPKAAPKGNPRREHAI